MIRLTGLLLTALTFGMLLTAGETTPPAPDPVPAKPPIPPVFSELEQLMEQKEYPKVIELADKSLEETPGDFRLIAIKSYTQFKFMDDRPAAFATVDAAIADYPKLYDLYDFKVELIRQSQDPEADNKIFAVYRQAAINFADRPLQLSDLGFGLLQRPLGEGRLAPALLLLRTARDNMANCTPSEKYLILTNLARGCYFASRADLAAKVQTEANVLAANEVDKVTGTRLLKFYNEADKMAKELSNVGL
ncbi:MAG: hypothetical protein PHI85_08470 [Victivallaceae bacterium]|nr:hypothetical protein [Victivallaceae bacterium]